MRKLTPPPLLLIRSWWRRYVRGRGSRITSVDSLGLTASRHLVADRGLRHAPRHRDDPAAVPGRWVVDRNPSEEAGAGHEAAAAGLAASGLAPVPAPFRSGEVQASSTWSGSRLISKASTMRITPTATAQI